MRRIGYRIVAVMFMLAAFAGMTGRNVRAAVDEKVVVKIGSDHGKITIVKDESFMGMSLISGLHDEAYINILSPFPSGSVFKFEAHPAEGVKFLRWETNLTGRKFKAEELAKAKMEIPPPTPEEYTASGLTAGVHGDTVEFIAVFDHGSYLKKIAEKPATLTSTGVKEHYKCEKCGKIYLDAELTKEVTKEEDLVIPKLTEEQVYPEVVSPKDTASVSYVNSLIKKLKTDDDLKGSSYWQLKLQGTSLGKKKVKLAWKKVKGATKYYVFKGLAGSGKAPKQYKIVNGKLNCTVSGLKAAKDYKFIVVAAKGKKVLSVSRTIYVTTDGGLYGNVTGIKKSPKRINAEVDDTYKFKGKLIQGKKKQRKIVAVRYEIKDPTVASVTKKGKVKGLKEGYTYVYAFAQNGMGVYAKVKVTDPE
ncbi:MAG: Ig-like domain-containing protein [Lachnospiraceae bacterium]|nr:Ig-like domain-containing protein [Lachnospiraceae bacterium]